MRERISFGQFDLSSAPRLIPIEQKQNRIDQRILYFSPLYEDICREIYCKFKPLPKDVFSKINSKYPELNPFIKTIQKAEEFRLSGGDIAGVTLAKQLQHVGENQMAFFLMRDVVSAKLNNYEHTLSGLRSCDFGSYEIYDCLVNMGICNGIYSDEARNLNFNTISSNILNNPFFNKEKMI